MTKNEFLLIASHLSVPFDQVWDIIHQCSEIIFVTLDNEALFKGFLLLSMNDESSDSPVRIELLERIASNKFISDYLGVSQKEIENGNLSVSKSKIRVVLTKEVFDKHLDGSLINLTCLSDFQHKN
jgi:hypothetical protein